MVETVAMSGGASGTKGSPGVEQTPPCLIVVNLREMVKVKRLPAKWSVRDGMVASLLFFCLFGLTACLGLNAGETKRSAPDKVIKQGPWELQIYYRNKGTRSEGQQGILFYQGNPVKAKEAGEEKETDLGLMKYYGPEGEQKVPWAPSGWNFADKGKMLPSWQEQNE